VTGLHKPSEIAELVEKAGVAKASIALHALIMLGVLAGAFIAFGAAFYIMSMTGTDLTYGPSRVLGGVVFSLGLILVVIGGAELFTGNALIVMAWVDRHISTQALLRNWTIVWCANLAGALLIAAALSQTSLITSGFGATAATIATGKMALAPLDIFVRAILCNSLVCLAVWLSFAATDVTGKILSLILPVAAFVALGLDHSIANMFLLPLGLMAGAEGSAALAAQNILIATTGNILGGAGGVALAYRYAFKPQA
jgi:formate/nitrite transporter